MIERVLIETILRTEILWFIHYALLEKESTTYIIKWNFK